MKLVISAVARRELSEIARYLFNAAPEYAAGYMDAIDARIHAIADRPLLYAVHDAWGGERRSARCLSHRIIFRVTGGRVEILRVLHTARDIAGLL